MLRMELAKTEQDEFELITDYNLEKVRVKYSISQVFEPEHEINEFAHISKKNLHLRSDRISFEIHLEELMYPERCQLKIKELLFFLKQKHNLLIPINEIFPFLEGSSESVNESNIDIEGIIEDLHNEDLLRKFQKRSEKTKDNIDLAPVSEHFGAFEILQDTKEIFSQLEKKSSEIDDKKIEDLDYLLRERLLECLFLSVSHIISLKILDDPEIKAIAVKIIQKYFGQYLTYPW